MSWPVSIAVGWLVMIAVMGGLWLVQRARLNAAIVDVAWAFGTGLLGVGFAALASGLTARRLLVGTLAALWSLRLAGYLLRRVRREPEDGRYQTLRRRWGDSAQRNLFLFFQVQAVWAVLFAVPMLAAASSPRRLGWLDAAGAALWLLALAGESLADAQLSRFRADPDNRGRVCAAGLWRYSRHPNYFFEWLHWWAYVLIAGGPPYAWVALPGPLLMLFFLFRVTGIPPTEAQALESRGDAYREYQRTTSVFVPWPPRR